MIAQIPTITITSLDLGIVHAGLHLHELQIRRARTRLGQVVGVAHTRVDVVWGSAAPGSVLESQGWEQATDDWEV